MKTKLFTIAIVLTSCTLLSQKDIKISDLELPNAPAFTVLDYSPTIISNPATVQAFTLSLINATNASSGIPTDYALEFSPYWIFKNRSKNFSDYIDNEENKVYSKPFKNMSFSLASVKKDSIQNVSVGIRTNLVTINNKKRVKAINELKTIELINFNAIVNSSINPVVDPYTSGSKLSNDWKLTQLNLLETDSNYLIERKKVYDKVEEINTIKPLFSLDVASAYSHFFDQNEFKSGKFGRFGAWMTMNGNLKFKNDKNYLSVYQYTRYLINEMNFDIDKNTYQKEKNLDVGAKIELQFNNLSFGYEYIKRTNQTNNYRSVGSIKYKINDKVSLNGGFGKNFEKTDNLVSFLGVSWGISANNEISSQ